jgi:hypothetical protein
MGLLFLLYDASLSVYHFKIGVSFLNLLSFILKVDKLDTFSRGETYHIQMTANSLCLALILSSVESFLHFRYSLSFSVVKNASPPSLNDSGFVCVN